MALGAEVLDLDSRMGLPSEDVMKAAMARAMDEGADPELVEKMGYGKTAIVATMKFSDDGPVVAFRADMDSNDVIESKASNHTPAKNGGEYINYPLSIKIYLVLRGFKAILLMMRFQGFFVVFRNLIPVNNAEEFLDIVWATVLVVQVVCMFPNI